MEQIAPSSQSTEIAVLGAALLDATAINDALEHLLASDFYLDSHRKIYTVIMDLVETGNPVDFLTVQDELSRRKELEAVGGPAYLAFLTEGIPRNLNIESYVRIIKDKSVLRQLMALGNTFVARAADNSETSGEILADVEEQILELTQAQVSQTFTTILDAAMAAGGVDQYIEQVYDPRTLTGLPTGFIEIDAMLGGLQKKELIIIAARPSMGKTSWGLNLAQNVVLKDALAVVAVFSIEMSKESLFKRLLASLAEVSARRAQQGHLSDAERYRLAAALVRIGDRHLPIDDTASITTLQMRAKCRRLKQQRGRLDLIVIDYLQLMKGVGKFGNRQEEVSSISRGLKALSKELDVPVVALAQLSRKSEERGDKRPILSDLRESGSIEQDADVVAFIHRAEYYAAEDDQDVERGIAEFILGKNRNGPTGTRKLAYSAEFTKFFNLHVERGATSGGHAY